jgi:hypothetical protein
MMSRSNLLFNACDKKPVVASKSIYMFKVGSAGAFFCSYGNAIQCITPELFSVMSYLASK